MSGGTRRVTVTKVRSQPLCADRGRGPAGRLWVDVRGTLDRPMSGDRRSNLLCRYRSGSYWTKCRSNRIFHGTVISSRTSGGRLDCSWTAAASPKEGSISRTAAKWGRATAGQWDGRRVELLRAQLRHSTAPGSHQLVHRLCGLPGAGAPAFRQEPDAASRHHRFTRKPVAPASLYLAQLRERAWGRRR